MQKTLVAATVAALVGVAGAANAADVYSGGAVNNSYVAPVYGGWTGFHVGLGIGAEAVDHELGIFGVTFDGIAATGVVGTAEVGYDRQFGSIVAGVFANYDFGDNVATTLTAPFLNASINQTDSWTLGGRIGYLLNQSTLAYSLAGVTQSRFQLEGVPGVAWNDTFSGWTVGGGLETKLFGNWTVKGEYRYTDYDQKTFFGFLNVNSSAQTARLVLSYKLDAFGGGYDPLK